MAAASCSNAPVGGESASDEESVCSDDLHSAVSSSGLSSDEEQKAKKAKKESII